MLWQLQVHGLSDLLCLRALWVSHCKVSLQTLPCSFRKASLYGRPHALWFILLSQLAPRSTSVLSCPEAGMGFLAAWQDATTPRCAGQMVLYRGSSTRSTQETSRALLRALCSLRESSLGHQGCNQQQSLPRAARGTGSDKHQPSTSSQHSHYRATGPTASILSSTEARTNTNLIDSFPRATAQSGAGAQRKERAGFDMQRITEDENKY